MEHHRHPQPEAVAITFADRMRPRTADHGSRHVHRKQTDPTQAHGSGIVFGEWVAKPPPLCNQGVRVRVPVGSTYFPCQAVIRHSLAI
jgi:hypothetical protein